MQILIVGDELGLAEPLAKAFQKAGHRVECVVMADQAGHALAEKAFDYAFVDCMLPGGSNGVDFVASIRAAKPDLRTEFVLMSGIFIDKAFIKEALERTQALAFVEKRVPFDPALALKWVKARNAPAELTPRQLLYQIFSREKVTGREKRKLIESLEEVSGFDLPFIYSLLVETQSSGYLNIYEKNGKVSGITFSGGFIVGVDAEDETTRLGEMLIQSGYVLPEDLAEAISEKNNRKLGLRLIRGNRMSPHALDLVMTEQMNIRLSRTISDHTIRINFAASEIEKSFPSIDSDQLQFYLHDWIASKLTTGWLTSLYMPWANNAIVLSPLFRPDHPALEMGLVRALPNMVTALERGTTLAQLLMEKDCNSTALYKGIHFLLTKGLLTFGSRADLNSEKERLIALQKLENDLNGKSSTEIAALLGSENLRGHGLEEILGPRPTAEGGPAGQLWTSLRGRLQEASSTGERSGRDTLRQEAAQREIEDRLRTSQMMEEARQALGFNQFAKAQKTLADIQKTQPNAEHLHILMSWAKLGQMDPAQKVLTIKEVEFELMQVPAEERYDAQYSLVLGLLHKAKGDTGGARKHFERAIALNSSFMAARRELSALDVQMKKDKEIFGNVDLAGLVGGLFRRNK